MRTIQDLLSRLAALLRWHRRHLFVEMRDDGLYWARARRSRGRNVVVESGRFGLQDGQSREELLRSVALGGAADHHHVEVAFRSPDLVHKVTQIPAISAKEAALVAERRASTVCDGLDTASCFAHVQARRDAPGALWLVAAPLALSQQTLDLWSAGGFDVQKLSSRQLALANLVRILPEIAGGSLRAIVDLEAELATCVLADADGWVFGRSVPLRLLGHRAVKIEPVAETDGEQRLELAVEPISGSELDPLEQLAERAELLTMELKRTFHYVEGELGASSVAHVFLSGSDERTQELRGPLADGLGLPVDLVSDSLAKNLRGPVEPAAAIAIGLALSPDPKGGNLLPQEIQQRRAEQSARFRLIAGLALSVLLLAACGITFAARSVALTSRVGELTALLAVDEAERVSLAEMKLSRQRAGRLAVFGEVIDRPAPKWTALLGALGRVMPDPIAVQRLQIFRSGEGWSARITADAFGIGVADAARAISDLSDVLDESPLAEVESVVREEATRQPGETILPGVRFRIDARLASVEPGAPPDTSVIGRDDE